METLDIYSDCYFCYKLVIEVYFGKDRLLSIMAIWFAVKNSEVKVNTDCNANEQLGKIMECNRVFFVIGRFSRIA